MVGSSRDCDMSSLVVEDVAATMGCGPTAPCATAGADESLSSVGGAESLFVGGATEGALPRPRTSIVTTTTSLVATPSVTKYEKLTVPLKLVAGV
jgi:hypothetical protein